MPDQAAKRIAAQRRGPVVSISVDGSRVHAHAGEMLAAALMAAGLVRLRGSPRCGDPRGAFCLMGVCQECLVRIDGKISQACLVAVSDGLAVELLHPLGERK